jgi:acyl carrier protein
LKTLILAALIIALNTAAGVELPAEELAALLNAGELALLENLLKTLWRRVFSGI